MTEPTWPERFEEVLRTHVTMLDTQAPLTNDLDLAEHGLDSLATVSLLLDLEDEFGVTIPDEMLTATTFATPADLWAVMGQLVNA
jgi:acyl carrier protein